MRDHYKREKKEERGSTGKATKKKRAVYWERLQFLDTAGDERSSSTNVLSPSSNEASNPEEPNINNLEHSEEHETPERASERSPIVSSTPTSDCHEAIFRPPAPKSRKEKVAIQKYFQERTEDRLHLKRCLDDIVGQPLPEDNEIDLFFRTMAATVKKFRPDLATKAKSSVFKIITDLEIVNQQLLLPANEFHSDSYSSSSSHIHRTYLHQLGHNIRSIHTSDSKWG
ncbi:unnamed protein product [Acanthoscelides obtectus]|uniref:BESS domain-containing protein n=1 Tax=Acanthoscelides obtectus TaxID=200917 RepID=A0A9P0PMD8_ACAOB|nr:unnamed protein product [Acanthoscelides obtectus]CAK1620340.1 hypothetical protein AOBTE_LOCUS324 [Acanthoscelides obtectus]